VQHCAKGGSENGDEEMGPQDDIFISGCVVEENAIYVKADDLS
jgi:hypothetical protein